MGKVKKSIVHGTVLHKQEARGTGDLISQAAIEPWGHMIVNCRVVVEHDDFVVLDAAVFCSMASEVRG